MISIDEQWIASAAPNADAMKNGRGLVVKGKFTALRRNHVFCEAASSIERKSAMGLSDLQRGSEREGERNEGILAGICTRDNLHGGWAPGDVDQGVRGRFVGIISSDLVAAKRFDPHNRQERCPSRYEPWSILAETKVGAIDADMAPCARKMSELSNAAAKSPMANR